VLIVSGSPDEALRAMKMGAVGFVEKPASRELLTGSLSKLAKFVRTPSKSLLLIESDEKRRREIVKLLGNGDITTTTVKSGSEALARLETELFDCAIVDAALPGMNELMGRFAAEPRLHHLPMVIYASRKLEAGEEQSLRAATRRSVAKLVSTPEHLLDESGLYLHRLADAMPEDKRELLLKARESDPVLAGRRVLVVDDDARNLYSITSILERYKMRVLNAENGRKGIETLMKTPDIDIVLMDVMMPEMNGYEAMTEIRRNESFRTLPIISLTAKAMKGDREKCLSAGASDYIPKPVDVDQLLAVLRVWLA
jgi:CheY-like chemotaxis protein